MSTETKDEGPFFPTTRANYPEPIGAVFFPDGAPGISLRDWFAGQALEGLCANAPVVANLHRGSGGVLAATYKALADESFGIADAMLAARNKNEAKS